MKRIAMWSGPRNISTAMMRSWENRSDCFVVDEPFYAFYLNASGVQHPGREEVLSSMDSDWDTVVHSLVHRTEKKCSIFYQKHMAHHMRWNEGLDWLDALEHVFLIREPAEMIPSLHEKLDVFDLHATGLPFQIQLYKHLTENGKDVPVLDARRVLEQPEVQLRELCHRLEVPFEEHMLRWRKGPRDTDGVWAKYWYSSVEQTTGFQQYKPKRRPIPHHLKPVYMQAQALYETLYAHAIGPS